MCGIVVGLCFGNLSEEEEKLRQVILRYLTNELLLVTEDRGKDATGAAVLFDDHKFFGIKRGQKVSDFMSKFGESPEYYGSFIKVWNSHPANTKVYLGHCRAGTIGDKEDNENNHPIKIGNLVGIHNGKINNHYEIFKNLGCDRDGKVDSEAIFRLFEYYTNKGKEPFTMDMIQSVADRLDGQYAISLFNADNTEQVPIMRDGRPVELILIKSLGILLAVSELKFWNEVHFRYERLVYYHKDIHDQRLRSLLAKDNVEKKMLPDDSAAIFDLAIEVDSKTTIDDLGEHKKITRTNKMWKAPTTTSAGYQSGSWYDRANNRSGGWSGGATGGGASSTKDKKEESDVKKRRVFDNITKRYVVKAGDKILEEDTAASIPVGGGQKATMLPTKKEEDDKAKEKKTSEAEENKQEKKQFAEDNSSQEPAKGTLSLVDKTPYKGREVDNDIVDIDPSSITVLDNEVVEVDMKKIPPHIVDAARKAYNNLPRDDKGYRNPEDIAEAGEFKDAETAESLGVVVVANRLFRKNWTDGFMAGYMQAQKEVVSGPKNKRDEKQVRSERHIAGLKSLVLLLSEFAEFTGIDAPNTNQRDMRAKLTSLLLNDGREIDITNLSKIFNSHEKDLIRNVRIAIENANDLKKNTAGDKEQ